MTAIANYVDQGFDPLLGKNPELRWGKTLPDGDQRPWKDLKVGSLYVYYDATNDLARTFRKAKNDQRDDDWCVLGGLHCITETVTRAQFTDGGSTAGTYNLAENIPAGAWVMQTVLENVTGFTGDTSAVLIVGDGTDTDRYNTGTPSVFTTVTALDTGVPSGTKIHTAEKTVTLTITSGADFTNVAAGQLTIRIYYLK